MKTFIVYQLVVEKKKMTQHGEDIVINAIVRKVKAKSEEEAMGKFIIGTKEVEAIQRLEIVCAELSRLKSL